MMVQQGHRYRCWLGEVLALASAEPGDVAWVARIDDRQPYNLGARQVVEADELEAMPMRYFHGAIPEARG